MWIWRIINTLYYYYYYDVNLSFDEIGKHECPLKFTLKSSDLYTKFEHEDLYATFSWKVNFKLVSRKENFYI